MLSIAARGFLVAAPDSTTTSSAPVAPAPAVAPIVVTDAMDKKITLNPQGRVTVILLCTEESQTAARDAGRKVDAFRGLPPFRVIAVVDLRDSLGNMVEGIVKWRMQDELDDESERLTPFYRANGNKNDPRPDLTAVPDFKGTVCKALGWTKVSNTLRAVVFGPNGQPLQRWDSLTDYNELYAVVAKAMGK